MSKQSSDSPIPSNPESGISQLTIFLRRLVFITVLFVGGFLWLFVIFASNGGAGGSSEMSPGAWTALIVYGAIYLPAVFFTARWTFRS